MHSPLSALVDVCNRGAAVVPCSIIMLTYGCLLINTKFAILVFCGTVIGV